MNVDPWPPVINYRTTYLPHARLSNVTSAIIKRWYHCHAPRPSLFADVATIAPNRCDSRRAQYICNIYVFVGAERNGRIVTRRRTPFARGGSAVQIVSGCTQNRRYCWCCLVILGWGSLPCAGGGGGSSTPAFLFVQVCVWLINLVITPPL